MLFRSGLWEYPNELSQEGAGPEQWGLSVSSLERAGAGKHIFTHIEWRMAALIGELEASDLPAGWVWANRMQLRDVYAVPSAFQAFSQIVADRLGRF